LAETDENMFHESACAVVENYLSSFQLKTKRLMEYTVVLYEGLHKVKRKERIVLQSLIRSAERVSLVYGVPREKNQFRDQK